MKYCPHCGQPIKSDALVCPYCGYQQSRVSRDEHKVNENDDSEFNSSRPAGADLSENSQPDDFNRDPYRQPVKYSHAKLTVLDMLTLGATVLNAATLFFLGFQGLLRPFYINNLGTFVTVILSLLGIILIVFEIRQNRLNRLPNLASWVALAGNVIVFVLIFMFNQRFLLISMVLLLIALYLFDRELKKVY